MNERHLSQQELAERWGINGRTLEGWRSRGIGPDFLKLGGRVVYRIADVHEYESKCLRKSTGEVVAV